MDDLIPVDVKVLGNEEGYNRLVINGYKLHNLVDPDTQEVIDNFQTNEEVIDEFETDELIISSSLNHTLDSLDKMVNGLGSLGFEVRNPINDKIYRNFILHDIPWFPSFSVKALTFEEPVLAARCIPRLFYQTQVLVLESWWSGWSPPPTFETTRSWICAGPFDDYVSFHLAEFIDNMHMIMGKTYKDFLGQDVY